MAGDIFSDDLEQLDAQPIPAVTPPKRQPAPITSPADTEAFGQRLSDRQAKGTYAAPTSGPLSGFPADPADKLTDAMSRAPGVPADTAARVFDLQIKTGLPTDLIRRNLDDVEKQAATAGFDPAEFRKKSPLFASWLEQHPLHASLVSDDMVPLTGLEQTLGFANDAIRRAAAGLYKGADLGLWSAMEAAGDVLGIPKLSQFGRERNAFAAASAEAIKGDPTSRPAMVGGAVLSGFESIGSSAPILALGLMTGTAEIAAAEKLGLLLMGTQTGGHAYSEGREKGQGVFTSLAFGFAQGLVEGWTEQIPFHRLLGDLAAKTGLIKTILHQALPELAGEEIATALQDMNEWAVLHPELPFSSYLKDRPEAFVQTAIATVIATGVQTGVFHTLGRLQAGPAAEDTITRLGKDVKASKLAERSPEKLEELAKHLAGEADTFYVPLDTWRTYWQDQKEDPAVAAAEMTGSDTAYQEALRTGEDLQIPSAAYTAKLAGTEHNAFFANEIRLGPDLMNAREHEEFVATQVAQEQAVAPPPSPRERMREALTQQLVEGGRFLPRDAEANALIMEAGIGTMAEAAGEDPFQTYSDYGLTVSRPDLPAAERHPDGGTPTAIFLGYGPDGPLYNVQGGPSDRSTLGTAGLEQLGIAIPETPADTGDRLTGAELRARALDPAFARALDAPPLPPATVKPDAGIVRIPGERPITDYAPSDLANEAARIATMTGARRAEKGPRSVVDKTADAAQNPERYLNVETRPASPAEEGHRPGDASGQQPRADVVGTEQGRGDGDVAQPGRTPTRRGIPGLDEVFVREPKEATTARLTPEVERNLRWILEELDNFRFTKASWHWLTDEAGTGGNAAGGHADKRAAVGGAPVYADVLGYSPVNTRTVKGEQVPAREASGSRAQVQAAVEKLLLTGHVTTNLMEGALRVAEARNAGDWANLERPMIPAPWGEPVTRAFTDQLAEAIDREQQPANLLDERDLQDSVETGPDGDTSFDPTKFYQSLFDDLPAQHVDTLTDTGEQQPRLPGDVGAVREQDVKAPEFEAPFSLTSQIAKPTKGGQTTLFQSGQPALTPENVAAWAQEVQDRVGPDLSRFEVSLNRNGDLALEWIMVDRGAQRAGLGSKVMLELTRFADLNGRRIVLSPAEDSGATRANLVKFYQRFGFVSNEGHYRDDSIRAGMYRDPTAVHGREFAQPPKRAALRFGADRQFHVDLLARADLTSFLHEGGHIFLEVMGDLVDKVQQRDPGTRTREQTRLVDDYAAVLKDLNVTSREEIGTAQHEQFAASFERYLMEGHAPSVELRSAFSRVRAWFLGVYKQLRRIGTPLSPQITGVFDRMLASEDAIAAADRDAPPLFTSAEQAGMSPQRFAIYQTAVETAHRTERERLDRQMAAEVREEQSAQYQAAREAIRTTVAEEVHQQPTYRALAAMRDGTTPAGASLLDGSEPVPLRLNRRDLVAQFGEARVAALPKGILTAKGGTSADAVAGFFGFSSGDELLKKVTEAQPMAQAIDTETDARMLAEHPTMLTDGTLYDQAREANASEDREALIRAEVKTLWQQHEQAQRAYERRWLEAETKLRIAYAEGYKQVEIDALTKEVSDLKAKARGGAAAIRRALPSAAVLTQLATERIQRTVIRDLKPALFWSASRQGATRAIALAARQDLAGAIEAKTAELTNLAYFREASAAVADVTKRVDFARSLDGKPARARLGLAGATYQEQVDGVLDRLEFARIPARQLARRARIGEWVQALEAQGMPANGLPAAVLDDARRINWKQVTVAELVGVTDGLRMIVHLATMKNRLVRAAEAREFAVVRDGLTDSVLEHQAVRPRKMEITPIDAKVRQVAGFYAAHRKMSDILQAMDGYVDGGPMWDAIMRPVNAAGDARERRNGEMARSYDAILERHYPGRARTTLSDQRFIPAINGSLSHEAVLAVAQNWGNLQGQERLTHDDYRQWTESQVRAILNTLDATDVGFLNDHWSYVNAYWPEIAAKMQRLTGLEPEKVDAIPFSVPAGQLTGGYHPLMYDKRLSAKAAAFDVAQQGKMQTAAAYVRTTTSRGHEETRVAHTGLPVRLELGVTFQHLESVIHDLTHHEMLIDVTRLLRDPKLQRAILDTHGDLAYRQLTTGLEAIAGSTPTPTLFDPAANFLRSRAQIAGLAFNFWTAVQQPLGLFNGMARVGPVWVARGVKRWMRDAASLENTLKWIASVSPLMRDRAGGFGYTQDLHDLRASLRESGGWFDNLLRTVTDDNVTKQTILDAYLWHIGIAQRVADIPTWLGGYEKMMASPREGRTAEAHEARAIALADQFVLDSQGGGTTKDLSAIQRGGPVAKLFMTFYSYGNMVLNATSREVGRTNFRSPASIGEFLGNLSLIYAVPALLTVAMSRAFGRSGGDDDDWTDWLGDVGQEMAATALNGVVLFRELGGLFRDGVRGYEGPAGARLINLTYDLGKQVQQGELDDALWHAAIKTGGALWRIPAMQIQRSVDGWVALHEGRTHNPMALLVGARTKPR